MKNDNRSQCRFRFLRVSLRSLLLVVCLISVWLATHVWRYQAEQAAATQLATQCPRADVTWTNPFWARFSSRSIFSRVTKVAIEDDDLTDKTLLSLPIADFRYLETIFLACPRVSSSAAITLSERLPSLTIETLVVEEEIEDLLDTSAVLPIGCYKPSTTRAKSAAKTSQRPVINERGPVADLAPR